jgi:hypothetical protein
MSRFWATVSGSKSARNGKGRAAHQTDPDGQAADLDVNSPHDAFDILRHNVRRVRKERLARRIPPHQRHHHRSQSAHPHLH